MVWYSHLLKNILVCDPDSQSLWHSNEVEVDAFLEFPCFF